MAEPSNSTVDIQAAVAKKVMALRDLCETYAYQNAQNFAQENAPWTDRTTEARKKLKGYVIDDGEALGWGIMHRVEYGKHLETANDGKYAILKPTVENFRAQFLEQVREIMGGKG